MQLDVGIGDVMVPGPVEIAYPTLLDFPAPRLKGYPRETAIAEKFEAMVKLGTLNSRMKDFYDIWILSRQFGFAGPTLAQAVTATFANRGTTVTAEPVALTTEFSENEVANTQWRAFVRKGRLANAPASLGEAVGDIARFLLPVARAHLAGGNFKMTWTAGGPWRM